MQQFLLAFMPFPLTTEEILSSLDLNAVSANILIDPESPANILPIFDFEDAKTMVWSCAEKWLAEDLQKLVSLKLEAPFTFKTAGYEVRGVVDLSGIYASGDRKGCMLVADWKTSDGDLDKNWADKLISSWQFKTYAHALKAEYVSYRGVNRRGKTREVCIKVPDNIFEQVREYYAMTGDAMESLKCRTVWPRSMPKACGMFGSTCQFKNDCETNTMPQYIHIVEHLSYSSADKFWMCPEKFRRMSRARGSDDSDATRLGKATHRGLQNLYSQAFAKYASF